MTTQKPNDAKAPDLRHGLHGTVNSKSIDAGQSPETRDRSDALKPATPDVDNVATGQTTHE